jgi:hypothetical protein
VFCISASEAYAAGGNGTLARWDGTAWSEIASGTPRYLSGIWAVGGQVFVVGGMGTVIRKP